MPNKTSPTLSLVLVALALALAGLVGWFLLASKRPTEMEPGSILEPGIPASAAHSTPPEPPLAPTPVAPAVATPARAEVAAGPKDSVLPTTDELADAIWVEGSLRFPENTPIDEQVVVVADGKDFKKAKDYRALADRQGRFRVAFAKGSSIGRLGIEARYLYLEEKLRLKLGKLPADIRLEPQLGGCIAGTIALEPGAETGRARIAGTSVTTWGWRPAGGGSLQRSAKVGVELGFELRAMPADRSYTVQYDPGFLTPLYLEGVLPKPGQTTPLELRARPGASLSGRLTDEQGRPVAEAQVVAIVSVAMASYQRHVDRQTQTDAQGAFALEGLPKGKLELTARKKGLADEKQELDLAEGAQRADIALVLRLGNSVAGRVLWPEGGPAAGARVSWSSAGSRTGFGPNLGAVQSVESDAEGRFRATGLGEGSVNFRAQAERAESTAIEGAGAGQPGAKPKKKERNVPWKARAEDVTPGATDLVLTLSSGMVFEGRVVDDTGTPVPRGAVGLKPKGGVSVGPDATGRFFKNGEFALEGLREGEWEIKLKAKGYVDSQERGISLPRDASGQVFVMARAAVLEGVVYDPDGKVAEKALVLQVDGEERAPEYDWGWHNAVKCDKNGLFKLEEAKPIKSGLFARSAGFADSPALLLEPAPGQHMQGLVLRLSRGGRIAGELHASVSPRGTRQVQIHSGPAQGRDAYTDAAGVFLFDGLPAGKYELSLEPTPEQAAEVQAKTGQNYWWRLQSLRRKVTVEVVDGQTARVVLGTPPEKVIRVTGTVRRSGSPEIGAHVMCWGGAEGQTSQNFMTSTDEHGRYELELEQPGNYSFTVGVQGSSTNLSEHQEIPDVRQHALDFDLAAGSISGRVVDDKGRPLARINVSLHWDPVHSEHKRGGAHGNVYTEDDGTFRFDDLPAGSYQIDADEYDWERDRSLARARAKNVQLADGGQLEGLELRMARAGSLEVSILTSKSTPAGAANVKLLEQNLQEYENHNAAEDGRTEFSALAAGRYFVSASWGEELTPVPVPVDVRSGEAAKVELVLERGTLLTVRVVDEQGQLLGAMVRVVDARGNDRWHHPSSYTTHKMENGTTSITEKQVGVYVYGPLEAGTYAVSAANHDGVSVKRDVSLSGEEESSVKLALKR